MKMRLSSSSSRLLLLFSLLLLQLQLQLVQMSAAAANAAADSQHSVGHRSRRVAIGDFEAINTLLEGASIVLPPSTLEDNGLELTISDFYCTDIHLGDLNTNYTIGVNDLGQDTLFYSLRAFPFDMNCFADYSFTFGFIFSGSGRLEAFTDDNEVTAQVHLSSPTQFAVAPPNRAVVPLCQSVIRTDGNINFEDGGLLDSILNLGIVKDLISDLIDDEAANILCGEIELLGDTLFADLLNSTTFLFDEWLPPLPTDWTDTLFAEDNFVVPDGVTLLDFQQQDNNNNNASSSSSIGDLFVSLLDEADQFFGQTATDEETGETDLGINFFLRDLFLDENGALDLSVDELQAELDGAAAADDGGALLDTHDTLTQTSVLVDAVRLTGLDTLQAFNPFVMTGKHTIGNQFVWNSLALDIDLTLDVKPSSLDDSILQNANPEANLVEQFTISFDFNNLDVDFALFLPINEAKFEALTLGSLLDSENILPCFVSSLEALEVAGLDVSILDITPPVMEGFLSPGIGRVLSQLADAVFAAYRPTILRAVPGLFQGPIRDVLQSGLIDGGLFGTVGDGSECPNTPPPTGSVDFRDLFLDPEQALILGGSGEEPYGDVGSLIYGLLVDGLTDAGEDGTPKINEMLIRPFTKEQSGQEGVLRFNDTLIEFGLGGGDDDDDSAIAGTRRKLQEQELDFALNFSLTDLTIANLDTVVSPIELLNQTNSPSVLRNDLNLGGPLEIAFQLGVGFGESWTEINVTASIDSLSVFADISASIDAENLFQLPLGSILDLNCWLSVMDSIELDSNGVAVDPSAPRGLSLSGFSASMASLMLGTTCVSCENAGLALLPEVMQILDDSGSVDTLGDRIPELMESILMSDSMKTTFDRWIADAPRFCPSSPLFEEDAEATEYEFSPFPALSAESIDTILFTGIMAAEAGFVLFAETQRLADIEASSPLSAQDAFDPPDDIRFLDWTDIGNSTGFGSLADQVFEGARDFLGGKSTSEVFDLETLLEDLVNEDGVLEVETNFAFELDDLVISIDAVRVNGLEEFQLFDIFEPIAPQTLSVSAQFDLLDLELVLSADAPSTPEPAQVITMRFVTQNVTADIAIFAAFDLDKIGDLQLGSLLNTNSLLPCIMSTAYAFEIPQMEVTVGSFSNPTIEGLLPETDAATNLLTGALFDRFRSNIEEAIPKIFNGVGKDLIASLVSSSDEGMCDAAVSESQEGAFVDFRDLLLPEAQALLLGGTGEGQYGDLISSIFDLLKKEFFVVDPATGLAAVNEKLIRTLGESQSGTPGSLFFPGEIFSTESKVRAGGLRADIRLRASDIFVNNLDTVGVPLKILDPLNGEPYLVNNSATVGLGRPLELGLRFFLGLSSDDDSEAIENDMSISLSMEALKFFLEAFVQVSEKSFMQFPIRDITTLECWLAAIPAPKLDERGVMQDGESTTLAVADFMASAFRTGLNITCIECTGPKIPELSALLDGQAEGELSADLTGVINAAFDLMTEFIGGEFFRVVGDRALSDARKMCPHSPEYDPDFEPIEYAPFEIDADEDSPAFYVGLLIVGAVLLVAALVVVLTTKLVVRRRHRKWMATIPTSQVRALWKEQQEEDAKEADLDASTESMFRSDIIPYWVRLFIPVVILGNIGFFLSGHLSLGASVSILVQIGGQTFRTDNFYAFAMARSTIEIWNAGGRELAILIFLFSFVWPYTKQIMTLGLWFTPTSMVSVKTRGSVLSWLDFLAKWSMVDIFTLVVTIVAFRVSIKSPDVDFLPEDLYAIDLLVIPKWGLYANMIAQLISQVSSHFIIHYHRRIVGQATGGDEDSTPALPQTDTALLDDEGNEVGEDTQPKAAKVLNEENLVSAEEETKDRLCYHSFLRPHRGESDKLVARRYVSPLLVFVLGALCVLVVLGCVLPSFSLNALGLIGVLVETGQAFVAANTEYSVITSMELLFDQARLTGTAKDFIGLGSLTVLLIMTVLVVPVVQAFVLLVQWFAPLTKKQRYRLEIVLEILQAWQYAEVYLLSLLVGSWQLGPLSEFMINPYCRSLESLFSELVYYGLLKDEDAQCFKADVNIEPTFYVLLVGALLLALVNMFVTKAVSHYFRDMDGKPNLRAQERLSDLDALGAHEEDGANPDETIDEAAIHPVPVLFTDLFRWFLYREDVMLSRQSSADAAPGSDQMEAESVTGTKLSAANGSDHDEHDTRRMESSEDDEDDDEDEDAMYRPPQALDSGDDSSDIATISQLSISGFDASGHYDDTSNKRYYDKVDL